MALLFGLAVLLGVVLLGVVVGAPKELPTSSELFNDWGKAQGVRGELVDFLAWWAAHGPHPITITWMGGLRQGLAAEAAQLAAYTAGNSKARTLGQTAHGRGAALDLAPKDLNDSTVTAAVYALYLAQGKAAEARGLVWGGRWTKSYPPTKANPFGGDIRHIEIPNWSKLPYPPGVA